MVERLCEILDAGLVTRSDILPSAWVEQRRVMPKGSAFEGPFSYDRTPYLREIVDCLHPSNPVKKVAVLKGAQIGFSAGVIEAGIGWIISEAPGHILSLTGHADLSTEAMAKIDALLSQCGISHLIQPSVKKQRNSRTGDTTKGKEFPYGSLIAGSATNHKLLRQRSCQYGFIDDYDAAKKFAKQSGSTTSMIEQRFAAYYNKMKLFYISSPEMLVDSNVYPEYLKGDQRRWLIPCQRCGTFIPLEWSVEIEGTDGKEFGGMVWKEENGILTRGTVEYVCQCCGNAFDDRNKHEFLLDGYYQPTKKDHTDEEYRSYQLSSLYAPPGMFSWEYYANKYLQAKPPGEPTKEHEYKTFVNVVLGLPYESEGEKPEAKHLQKNIRPYDIGTLPERLSERDGNGKILMITCAADLNGKLDDARLDYEIVAWPESGASYSIDQGSIGTFIPRENTRKHKEDRERWTYEMNKENSVWPVLEDILKRKYKTEDGITLPILATGIDTGHFTSHAYSYIDKTNHTVLGLKGKDTDKAIRLVADNPTFKPARERKNLYLVEVNLLKDTLHEYMQLTWDSGNDTHQPTGFLNFPEPANGKYSWKNYFEHFEAEKKEYTENTDGQKVAARWVKTTANAQNHFWDVRIYNMVVRDIVVQAFAKKAGYKSLTWDEWVTMILKSKAR